MIKRTFIIILLMSFFTSFSHGSDVMIADIESLLKSLSEKDTERKELSLRLADLYFFGAVELEKKARLATEGMEALDRKALKYRRRALGLYTTVKKQYKLNDETEIKVNFQLARVSEQLGNTKRAMALWEGLRKQEQMLNIRREAVLKLAENAENNYSLKKAERLYKEALELCEDSCGFVRYRLGWVYRNLGKIELSLNEMKLALWDKKGQAQDEVLRDYIAVLSQRPGDGSKAVEIIENLAKKTNRKDLLEKLAYGFYAAGNKVAGTKTLGIVTERNPTLKNQVQLLEEYYGLRQWDNFNNLREKMALDSLKTLKKEDVENIEKIMRRLVVQLEAEQKQNPSVRDSFLVTNLLYLELFPTSEITFKIMRSWLALEKNASKKMERIADWLNGEVFKLSTKEVVELREERARLAQKENNNDILRSEMNELAKLYEKKEKKRTKAQYLVAHSYYKEENVDKALPLFVELAKAGPDKPSKWSLQAQNLALDIYNQKKDYDGLIDQADTWLKQAWTNPKGMNKELTEIRKIREQAEFEKAVAMGESEDALKIFFKYCEGKKLIPQSCQNAKQLAVKLKDQKTLVSVLEITNEKEALTNEYEIGGHYAKAAKMLEKRTPIKAGKWTFDQAIKIALLYELEGRFKERDKWLNRMVRRYRTKKVPARSENLFYSALQDAGMLNSPKLLSLKWSKSAKLRLARHLEEIGKGNKRTHKIFLAADKRQGDLWEYYHMKEFYKKAEREQSTSFYGKNSKRQFRRRLARIKQLDKYANKILNQLSANAQLNVVGVLYTSYSKLNREIRETPIPKGLNEEALAQVNNSLSTMARPFDDKAVSYRKLLEGELEKQDKKLEDLSEATYVAKDLLASLERPEKDKAVAVVNLDDVFPLLRQLNEDPLAYDVVKSLKNLYLDQGKSRLASYYEGRLKNLKKGGDSENI